MCTISLQPIIKQLESLFSSLNQKFYNNELPMPIITVSPDTTKGAYGWCTSWKAWKEVTSHTKDENSSEGFYEINICAEYLQRPFIETAQTLLHEMAHLYNCIHEIKDTSRGGTYHNKKYAVTATAHGLNVAEHDKYGWTITTLNDEAKAYIESMNITTFEVHREKLPKKSGTSKQSSRKYVCPICGCIVRATKEVNIICGDCNEPLQLVE